MRIRSLLVCLLCSWSFAVALGVAPARGAASQKGAPASCGTARHATYRHVVWIVLENVGYSVVGSAAAPYLYSLASRCGLATRDFAVAHPSLPNYLALTSGSTQGVGDDGEPASHQLRAANIFSQLGTNWRAYAESMPYRCDRVTSDSYAARHNPAVYYLNLTSACQRRDVPFHQPLDLSAAFTFIVPNVCNDMHSCPVAVGDAWLSRVVPSILASSEYRAHSLVLFITFDESDSDAANHVPLWVIAPTVPRGLRVGARVSHYSLLATTESLLGLRALAHARGALLLVHAFHL